MRLPRFGRRPVAEAAGVVVPPFPSGEELAPLRAAARSAATRFRLPLRRATRGPAGSWSGGGTGSSADFQDHRPYLPGDDPRWIDWQAYGRSGQLAMKLFRDEIAPAVDLLVDVSASMRIDAAKRARSAELALFVSESAAAAGCSVSAWLVGDSLVRAEPRLTSLGGAAAGGLLAAAFGAVPLRSGSLRVVVTDALFPSPEPLPLLRRLSVRRGTVVLLAPFAASEEEPDFDGDVELVDSESGERRIERGDAAFCAAYRMAYERHFGAVRAAARQAGAVFARVRADGPLLRALGGEPLGAGAVELV